MAKALLSVFALVAAIAGCDAADAEPSADDALSVAATSPEPKANPERMANPAGIQNLMRISERIYSGGEPYGEEGFVSLTKLGIKTVVSVDGAKPNIELARKHGLRYVHIPIGYDGVPEEAGRSLARLVKDGKAPFYIHCHHGNHRGPAAAVACIADGGLNGKQALHVLVRAGTSKDYAGLWRDVENYVPPPEDAELPELVEVAEVGSFAAAMAQIDRSYDNLKLCRKANWGVPADHPDLAPAQEALLVQEGLHEAIRTLGNGERDEQFKAWLAAAEALATDLRSDLQAAKGTAASERFTLLEHACKRCHQAYRN